MTFGSLFTGIGGMDLGLERAGMQCRWQVEIDDYARRVLAKHWPNVPKWDDVRTFPSKNWGGELQHVDLIAGGFPCQDISNAGKRIGIDGERSGLWSEFARIIHVVRPRYVLVENVAALLSRGMSRVLGDLAALGFHAEWESIPAAAFGAHFLGERIYIFASRTETSCLRRQGSWTTAKQNASPSPWGSVQLERLVQLVLQTAVPTRNPSRISDGVSHRVDRIRGLGNAVVPQVAEWIGRQILAYDAR